MKLLIIGGRGLLGQLVQLQYKEQKAIKIFSPTSEQVDFSNALACDYCLSEISPDVVLNLSALTDVDYCQGHLQESYLKNTAIVENLKKVKMKKDFFLTHISTDHVYDATLKFDQSNEDQVNFKNIYAFTKYAGELPILNDATSIVLRTNFFGKSISKKMSFTDWLFGSAIRDSHISLFEDITFSPLHVSSLIELIQLSIDQRLNGVFNCGSREGLTKAEFSKYFLQNIKPEYQNFLITDSLELPNRAPRPRHMIMDSHKLELALGVKLSSTYDEINKAIKEYSLES